MDIDTLGIKKSHLNAFHWKNEWQIPLAIRVENMQSYNGICYDEPDFLPRLFDRQMDNLQKSIALGSDYIPTLPILNYGTGIVASLLGAKISLANKNYPIALGLGFNIMPVITSLESIGKLRANKDNPFYEKLLAHYNYYIKHAPEGIAVCGSPEDPFDVAHVLRGNDLFLDMVDDPERTHELLDLCTQLVIDTEIELRTLTGQFKDGIMQPSPSIDGLWMEGFRIAGDSLIMISREMIHEFVIPCYEKMSRAFGCKLYVHFCSTKSLDGEQLLNAFLDCDVVVGLSTQFGLELMEKRYNEIHGKLMFDTCYDGAHVYYIEKYGDEKRFAEYVKRTFGKRSGLIVNVRVLSEEEGKRLVNIWHETLFNVCK